MESPILVLAEVARIMEQQGINYVLVGSLASSLHGMYRSTSDIDIVADVNRAQVQPLLEALEGRFYVDEYAIREAVDRQSSFNAIHFESVFKVDVFISKSDAFARMQLLRKQLISISPELAQNIYVATAEDTILAKLRWYRDGNQVSIHQWSDVLGMIGASGEALDMSYLVEWAGKLGVLELLEKAIDEAS